MLMYFGNEVVEVTVRVVASGDAYAEFRPADGRWRMIRMDNPCLQEVARPVDAEVIDPDIVVARRWSADALADSLRGWQHLARVDAEISDQYTMYAALRESDRIYEKYKGVKQLNG